MTQWNNMFCRPSHVTWWEPLNLNLDLYTQYIYSSWQKSCHAFDFLCQLEYSVGFRLTYYKPYMKLNFTISTQKRRSVHLYLKLFVEGLMSIICFCLRTVVSNIYCVVCFFFFVNFWLPLRHSLTFIYS